EFGKVDAQRRDKQKINLVALLMLVDKGEVRPRPVRVAIWKVGEKVFQRRFFVREFRFRQALKSLRSRHPFPPPSPQRFAQTLKDYALSNGRGEFNGGGEGEV